MELLDGETMEARWQARGRRLPVAQVLACADRILDVLAAAHDHGVVHRDVKPDNVFATTANEVKVLDFGIARLLDGTGATQSGQLLGSPGYMAPEQANGYVPARSMVARTSGRSARSSSRLVSGENVHDGSAGAQAIYAATQPARALESVAPWVPRDVAKLVNRALEFEREARWPSALAMQEALRATRGVRRARGDRRGFAVGAAERRPGDGARVPGSLAGTRTIVQGSGPGSGEGEGGGSAGPEG